MNFEARLEQLIKLIIAAGRKIQGENRFQMLAYLCQSAGSNLSQDFSFEYYEVTSPSLSKDLDKAIGAGLISREYEGELAVFSVTGDDEELEGPGFALVSKLNNRSNPTLDVLSTMVYLDRVGYKEQKLGEKIQQLKEQHKSVFEEAAALAKDHFDINCKFPVGVI